MAVNPAFFRNARRPNPSVWDMRLLPLISEQFEVPPVGDLRPNRPNTTTVPDCHHNRFPWTKTSWTAAVSRRSLPQSKDKQRVTGGNGHVLPAVDFVGHRAGSNLAAEAHFP